MKTAGKPVEYWLNNSEMFVTASFDSFGLSAVRIDLCGALARIPSLKNSKMPGKNFLNPETLRRLRAMDTLYQHAALPYRGRALAFKDEEQVVGLLICSKRAVRFDLDNCAASIKDWCEPHDTRNRGWGVGLIGDDAKFTVFPIRAEQSGKELHKSTLIIRRWADVGQSFVQWADTEFAL